MGDLNSIPGLERSPGEVNDYPLQYSGLENSLDYQLNIVQFLFNSRKGSIIINESRLRVSWNKELDQGNCLQKVMRTIFGAVGNILYFDCGCAYMTVYILKYPLVDF